ncbi:CLUMA_CG003089, isoform A [Clunio marinus]|uniref:CLUMA_CG003089, isoform A n=1 Tax=Clunio marinus TaxID=568069 RepID=A0A1J1HP73_9DIPT|nr:CLUMA_CG003089, isoform A [Clunio marinus]
MNVGILMRSATQRSYHKETTMFHELNRKGDQDIASRLASRHFPPSVLYRSATLNADCRIIKAYNE